MKRSVPWTGLLLCSGALWLFFQTPSARAQLGVFSMGGEDGGDGGFLSNPKKVLSNPWKEDAGNIDSGPGVMDSFKRFQGSSGGFLATRAPTIAEIMDSDASVLGGEDAGSLASRFDITIPNFGADIDAGVRDAGPIYAPVVLIARNSAEVRPVTSYVVPPKSVWALLPSEIDGALKSSLAGDGGRKAKGELSRAEVEALWQSAARHRGWREGAPAFLVSDVGGPIAARLIALGVSPDGHFYGAFIAPRDATQSLDPKVVLAASGNVGKYPKPQPIRQRTNSAFRKVVDLSLARLGVPFGMDPPVVGTLTSVVARGSKAARVEVHVRERRRPLCAELTLDEDGRLLRSAPWSPVCDHIPLTAVDVDGDGVDEIIWREGAHRVLRREDGSVVAEDPPPKGGK